MPKSYTLSELAVVVEGRIEGDARTRITGVSGIREARKGDLTFVANDRYAPEIHATKASAVVVGERTPGNGKPMIRVRNPDQAFSKLVEIIGHACANARKPVPGVHPAAVIGRKVTLGKDVSIGPYAVLEDGVSIGDRSVLYAHVYVGHNSRIGQDALIYPNVSIREHTRIGDRVIVHSGAVIGGDGFGFSTVKGVHHKIPQVGIVQIDDDVEVGACVTIDRARFDKTWIGRGTKIDNLVQIAHNVHIGENCFVIAQTGIAGSTRLGRNVTVAGQAGIGGHLEVGDNVLIAGRAGVTKHVPSNSCVSGLPAQPHAQELKLQATVRRLPEAIQQLEELEKRIQRLEQTAKNRRG